MRFKGPKIFPELFLISTFFDNQIPLKAMDEAPAGIVG